MRHTKDDEKKKVSNGSHKWDRRKKHYRDKRHKKERENDEKKGRA